MSSLEGKHVNVAMMTSGGLAPCLSSSIAQLMKYWVEALHSNKISGLTFRMYIDGYKGILTDDSFIVSPDVYDKVDALNYLGGSPIGNSRVKVRERAEKEESYGAGSLEMTDESFLMISPPLSHFTFLPPYLPPSLSHLSPSPFIYSSPTLKTALLVALWVKTRLLWKRPPNV
jgi:hypothetical protein